METTERKSMSDLRAECKERGIEVPQNPSRSVLEELLAAAGEPEPKLTGPAGYRVRFGTSDTEIVLAVREHAKAHSEEGGWDAVVEAWDDSKIIESIGWATSPKGAVSKVAKVLLAERDADAASA